MQRKSFTSNVKRIGVFALTMAVCMFAFSGCGGPEKDQAPSPEQDAANAQQQFPQFSTEIQTLSTEQLAALGEKNSLPTEFVFPNATSVQVVYPDQIAAVENGDAALDYIANSTFLLPVKNLLQKAEFAIFSRGFTLEALKEAQSGAVIQDGYPAPVETLYLKFKEPIDQEAIKQETFEHAVETKLNEIKIGPYEVTSFINPRILPIDPTGQTFGMFEDEGSALCFVSDDAVVFMSGTPSAFESYLSDKKGDERGIAAQRLARIPMQNVAAAFQYDCDFSTPNAQLVKLPVPITPELAQEIQKGVTAFQFMFDAATADGNLILLNVNLKSEKDANDLRKAIRTALMQLIDSLTTAQKNNPIAESNATFDGLLALLKSVQLNVEGDKVVAFIKSSPEGIEFIANSIKDLNDIRLTSELRQKYQLTEQCLQGFGAIFTRYGRENQTFPAAIRAEDGTPLLSWRVAILPYLGEQGQALYDQFKLDEPWNSDSNFKLLDQMPTIFASDAESNKTRYLVFNSPETPFGRSPKGLKLQDVADPYNTLSVVYASAENAVEWTKPETFVFNPKKPSDSFGDYVCGITLMGELISFPLEDPEKSAMTLAALVFGATQEDPAEDVGPADDAESTGEETAASEEAEPTDDAEPAGEETAAPEEAEPTDDAEPAGEETAAPEEAEPTDDAEPTVEETAATEEADPADDLSPTDEESAVQEEAEPVAEDTASADDESEDPEETESVVEDVTVVE
ncbi:MAG: DUF1559 domain-containing protein [Thermoguttaceae bacterium]|jgi:hypothetical protein